MRRDSAGAFGNACAVAAGVGLNASICGSFYALTTCRVKPASGEGQGWTPGFGRSRGRRVYIVALSYRQRLNGARDVEM